jgi:hypothetical protein
MTYPITSTHPSPRFTRLMEHLPSEVKTNLYTYSPDQISFNKNLKALRNYSIYHSKSFYKITQVAILAYRINQLTFEELSTVFMNIGAIDELFLNLRSHIAIFVASHAYNVCSGKSNYKRNLEMGNADYTLTQRMVLESYSLSEQYISNIAKLAQLDEPLLKTFFSLNDEEWSSFVERIKIVSGSEKRFTHFSLPEYGCWSTLYEHITSLVYCFKTFYFFAKPACTDSPPPKFKHFLLPSFTMMNTFLKVKAATHNRPFMELTPAFGCLSYDDLYILKKDNKTPFGLYCPPPPVFDSNLTKKHMKVIDGWEECGPLSFLLHDVYHGLRWQEMDQETSDAVLCMVSILDLLAKSLSNNSIEYKNLRKLRNSLVDGELIHSYPKKNSLFSERSFDPQEFKDIFKKIFWSDKLKHFLLHDDKDPRFILLIIFLIDDLKEELFSSSFENISAINVINHCSYPKVKNSCYQELHCVSALVINSQIQFIKASSRLAIALLINLAPMRIEALKGCMFYKSNLKDIQLESSGIVAFSRCCVTKLKTTSPTITINCAPLIQDIDARTIVFKQTLSQACSQVQSSEQIDWFIFDEKTLFFRNFKSLKMRILGLSDKNLKIYYENCHIDEVYIFVENREQAKEYLNSMAIFLEHSLIKNFYFQYPDPLESNSYLIAPIILSTPSPML